MDFSKLSMKKIRELIIFTALLAAALWKFEVVIDVLKTIWGIIFPFALGGAIAFVINVPMSFLEKMIFGKIKAGKKKKQKACQTGKPSSDHDTGCRCRGTGDVWRDPAAHPDYGNTNDEHCRFYSADAKLDSGFFT